MGFLLVRASPIAATLLGGCFVRLSVSDVVECGPMLTKLLVFTACLLVLSTYIKITTYTLAEPPCTHRAVQRHCFYHCRYHYRHHHHHHHCHTHTRTPAQSYPKPFSIGPFRICFANDNSHFGGWVFSICIDERFTQIAVESHDLC